MELMLLIYLIVGASSFIILLLMMIFGGLDLGFDGGPDLDIDIGDVDLDIDTGGPGVFSLPVLLSFLSCFGGLAALFTYFDVGPILSPAISAGASLLFASLLFLMVRYFFRVFQSDSTVKYGKLLGKKATVTIPIRRGMEGQVSLFTEQRGRTLIPAFADRAFTNNAEVYILESQGDTVKIGSKKDLVEFLKEKYPKKKGGTNQKKSAKKRKR